MCHYIQSSFLFYVEIDGFVEADFDTINSYLIINGFSQLQKIIQKDIVHLILLNYFSYLIRIGLCKNYIKEFSQNLTNSLQQHLCQIIWGKC